MPINSTRYVEITSAVVGASSVAVQSLTGRRFSSNPLVPAGEILTMLNGDTEKYFGAQSLEAVFAGQYFSYVSPAPASRPNNLQFAPYAPQGRAPIIFGARNSTPLADLQAVVDGSITVKLGETVAALNSLSLASATSYADIASEIQSAMRAAYPDDDQISTVDVTYNSVSGAFTIAGGTITNAPTQVLASTTGTDLGLALNLSGPDAIASPGSVSQSPLDAFIAAEQVTDSFGSATFSDEEMSLEQAIALATYNAGKNIKHMLLVQVDRANYQAWSAALLGIPSVGVILNATTGQYVESLPMAIMAATDYDRQNATVNYMYRQSALAGDVTDNAESLVLDAARVNYYGTTASAGQRISFFQRGYLMGGATAALDMNVHANEQWFKAYMAAALLSLQLSISKIPANNDGRGLILIQISDGVNRAKFNGTISVGKDLSAAQQIAVTEASGDAQAWIEVQNNGYWADVTIVDEVGPSGVVEYVAKYTILYAKNDVVRKIEGSHNLV